MLDWIGSEPSVLVAHQYLKTVFELVIFLPEFAQQEVECALHSLSPLRVDVLQVEETELLCFFLVTQSPLLIMNQYLVLDVTLDFHDLRIWVPLVRKQNEHGQLVNIILEQFSRKFIVGIVLAKLVGKMVKVVFISANDGDLLFEPIRAARDVLVDLVL